MQPTAAQPARATLTRAALLLGAALLLLALPACGDDDGPAARSADELFVPGPLGVGHREVSITYTPIGSESERTLAARVWYPAPADATGSPASYAVGGIVRLTPELALDDVAPAPGGPYPLVVYSHGNGGDALLAYPFAEYFASRGWVTVSMDHTGNTALDLIGSGSLARAVVALLRPQDVSAAIDAAAAGLGEADLVGLIDTDRVFLFGHSFGAYTTLVVGGASLDFDALAADCPEDDGDCAWFDSEPLEQAVRAGALADERVVAIAPQAPAASRYFVNDGYASIDLPVLLQSALRDATTTHEAETVPVWSSLDGEDDLWVEMPDGGHFSFITICHDLQPSVLALFQPDAVNDGCGEDFIDSEDAVELLRAYLIAFAERHVLGDAGWDAVLSGPALDARLELYRP